jgi:hypothetical protein
MRAEREQYKLLNVDDYVDGGKLLLLLKRIIYIYIYTYRGGIQTTGASGRQVGRYGLHGDDVRVVGPQEAAAGDVRADRR